MVRGRVVRGRAAEPWRSIHVVSAVFDAPAADVDVPVGGEVDELTKRKIGSVDPRRRTFSLSAASPTRGAPNV